MTGPQFPNNEPWGRRGKVTQAEDIAAATIPWSLEIWQDLRVKRGDQVVVTVPPGELWEIVSISFTFDTNNPGSDRMLSVRHVSAGQVVKQITNPTPAAHPSLNRYLFQTDMPIFVDAGGAGDEYQGPLPSMWLSPGDSIQTFTTNMDSVDEFERVVLCYRLYKDTAKSSIL